MNEDQIKELEEILDEAAAKLAEHFDSVQIVTTVTQDRLTHRLSRGRGDWYARKGACEEFIEDGQSQNLSDMIAQKLEPPEDDTEAWKNGD